MERTATLQTPHQILSSILTKIDNFDRWKTFSFAKGKQQLGWLKRFLALKVWLHDSIAIILSLR
jgi:hypothetical protein